ncbi:hypothetical protein Srufu_060080 [Streptomyces libani subsp. rufus]|nr:hypothetical protein Srufu_060080 [Streptomyces libani subsp. rufus]
MEPPAAPMGDIARADGIDPHIVSAPRVNGQPRGVSSSQWVVSVPVFDSCDTGHHRRPSRPTFRVTRVDRAGSPGHPGGYPTICPRSTTRRGAASTRTSSRGSLS